MPDLAMNRLQHSEAGFLRYMQMSRKEVFVFVEGKRTDPFFYGKICEAACQKHSFLYEICTARELPSGSGGKETLLKFFEYLRQKSALMTTLAGKRTAVIFYLDKDIDDLLRIRRRSPHVVYTKHYDVQNYVFSEGDLVHGSAAAASMDTQLLTNELSDNKSWCYQAALKWKEWVKMCIFVRRYGLPSQCNYRVTSRINKPLCGPVDRSAHATQLAQLKQRSKLSQRDFQKAYESVSRAVDRYYKNEEHNRVFKGKWYVVLLSEDIRRIAGSRPYDSNKLPSRLTSVIAARLDFKDSWTDDFRRPLEFIVSQL